MSEAEAAWQASEHQAEAVAEELNGAHEAQAVADAAAAQAELDVAAAQQAVVAADSAVTAAEAEVALLQERTDALADVSFRGNGGMSSVGALLTAASAEDYLDQTAAMQLIAADNQQLLDDAVAAQTGAETARTDAAAAEIAATTAAAEAAAAKVSADEAAAAATARKSELDAAVAEYKRLYEGLSLTEKARLRTLSEAAAAGAAGAIVEPVGDEAGQKAAAWAIEQLGKPYVWAATGPDSFDCSGLTQAAWSNAGFSIPRVSAAQHGLPEVPLDQLQPGDLVTYYTPVTHVAIYVGYGMVVNAASESLGIVYVSVEKGGDNPTGHRVPR